ncbi:hypothetical protein E1548_14110 [Salmonella enterica subsp. enterica serovar Telaviv]|nr:hypothetical protein [Salmonella enterica subsp. enterica serovar Telaviv]ECI7626567.1 hypothetical protein [Salmonella enterica subsp. enterica serovar Telaviv]
MSAMCWANLIKPPNNGLPDGALLIRPTAKENVGRIRRSRCHPATYSGLPDGATLIRPTTTTFIRQ